MLVLLRLKIRWEITPIVANYSSKWENGSMSRSQKLTSDASYEMRLCKVFRL